MKGGIARSLAVLSLAASLLGAWLWSAVQADEKRLTLLSRARCQESGAPGPSSSAGWMKEQFGRGWPHVVALRGRRTGIRT